MSKETYYVSKETIVSVKRDLVCVKRDLVCVKRVTYYNQSDFRGFVSATPPHITDPKAYIKSQGLGCHTLGNCIGDFFGQAGSKGKTKGKARNALVSSKVNLDGWSTSQFTKGLEKGINVFPKGTNSQKYSQ